MDADMFEAEYVQSLIDRDNNDFKTNQMYYYKLIRSTVPSIVLLPNLAERFLEVDFNLQILALKFINLKGSPASVLAWLELISQHVDQDPDFDDYGFTKISTESLEVCTDDSDRKYPILFDDLHDLSQIRCGSLTLGIRNLIRYKYGSKKATEVLSAVINNQVKCNLHELLMLIDRWEEYHDMPVFWAIQVASAEKALTPLASTVK